jgi:hypothetical protein
MRGTRKDFDEPSRADVENKLATFLDAPQRKSVRGGFADVPAGDSEELDGLILALIKYRYESDPDGDRPISWQFCDRTKQQPHSFLLLDRDDEMEEAALEKNLDNAVTNMSMAASALDRIQQARFWRAQDKKDAQAKS